MNTTPVKRSSSSSSRESDRSPQVCLEKPKLDLNRRVDKAEEEEKVKLLLRDDFIDDEDSLNIKNAPVLLPLIKEGFIAISLIIIPKINHTVIFTIYYNLNTINFCLL